MLFSTISKILCHPLHFTLPTCCGFQPLPPAPNTHPEALDPRQAVQPWLGQSPAQVAQKDLSSYIWVCLKIGGPKTMLVALSSSFWMGPTKGTLNKRHIHIKLCRCQVATPLDFRGSGTRMCFLTIQSPPRPKAPKPQRGQGAKPGLRQLHGRLCLRKHCLALAGGKNPGSWSRSWSHFPEPLLTWSDRKVSPTTRL